MSSNDVSQADQSLRAMYLGYDRDSHSWIFRSKRSQFAANNVVVTLIHVEINVTTSGNERKYDIWAHFDSCSRKFRSYTGNRTVYGIHRLFNHCQIPSTIATLGLFQEGMLAEYGGSFYVRVSCVEYNGAVPRDYTFRLYDYGYVVCGSNPHLYARHEPNVFGKFYVIGEMVFHYGGNRIPNSYYLCLDAWGSLGFVDPHDIIKPIEEKEGDIGVEVAIQAQFDLMLKAVQQFKLGLIVPPGFIRICYCRTNDDMLILQSCWSYNVFGFNDIRYVYTEDDRSQL